MYYGSDNHDIQFDGLAMGQAALLGWGYTSVIKAFTGRIPPHVREAADGDENFQDDYSDGFRFGFLIGRTVGNNFKKLRDGESPDKVSFYVSPRSANLVVTF